MNNGLFCQINFRPNTLSLYFFVGCTAAARPGSLSLHTLLLARGGEWRADETDREGEGEREEKLLMFDRVQ